VVLVARADQEQLVRLRVGQLVHDRVRAVRGGGRDLGVDAAALRRLQHRDVAQQHRETLISLAILKFARNVDVVAGLDDARGSWFAWPLIAIARWLPLSSPWMPERPVVLKRRALSCSPP
jgi:hypothetical protein